MSVLPVMVPRDASVTLRCQEGHPVQFVRVWPGVGASVSTPLVVDGSPTCAICATDEDMYDWLLMGSSVVFEYV